MHSSRNKTGATWGAFRSPHRLPSELKKHATPILLKKNFNDEPTAAQYITHLIEGTAFNAGKQEPIGLTTSSRRATAVRIFGPSRSQRGVRNRHHQRLNYWCPYSKRPDHAMSHTTISRGASRACQSYGEARRCPIHPGWRDIGFPPASSVF